MLSLRKLLVAITCAACGTISGIASGAPPQHTVLELLNRVPDAPMTAEEAAKWVGKNGEIIQPGLLALKKDIDAHENALAEIGKRHGVQAQGQAARQVEDLGKGMADVGIDMARMQSDPAYAKEVQARMKTMSPAEVIAMSQKMAKPMNQDPALVNQAKAIGDDPPAVQAAAEAGFAYGNEMMSRLNAHQALWRETDQAVKQIYAKPLVAGAPKPRIEYDSIGCDPGCQAQWDAYAARLLPLMIARDTEALKLRRAALQKQRTSVTDGIRTADKHLQASQYGATSQSQVNQGRIAGYDSAALSEVTQLITQLEDMVKNAALVVNCGKQAVEVPGAVCR